MSEPGCACLGAHAASAGAPDCLTAWLTARRPPPRFRLPEEKTPSGEDLLVVAAREWVELRAAGYAARQGPAAFRLSLVYTAAADVLPRVQDLCLLAQCDGGKAEVAAAKAQLAEIVAVRRAGGRGSG